eukprot:scaffold2727_cov275-Chaetoceros_neogracile.AAC.26
MSFPSLSRHCKRFAQTYESIAAHLHSTTSIKVAKVDGSIERALSSRFNIKGYPSFFLVSGWDLYEYNQPRTKNKMIQFALQKDDGMEPMSFITSPFGPFGMTRGFIISTGTKILDLFEYLVQEKGLGKTFAAVIMASVGIFFGTIFVILVGLALVPKPKRSSRDEAPYFVAIHGETWVRCNFFSCAKHELTHMLGFRDNLV